MGETKPLPTSVAFERRYSDDSGVEYGVRWDGQRIQLESVDKVDFPPCEIDWLIGCLESIRDLIREGARHD